VREKEKEQGEKEKERERERERENDYGRRGKSLNGIPSGPSNATQR